MYWCKSKYYMESKKRRSLEICNEGHTGQNNWRCVDNNVFLKLLIYCTRLFLDNLMCSKLLYVTCTYIYIIDMYVLCIDQMLKVIFF